VGTDGVDRRLISSGSPYEPVVGYSRAVVAGPHVFVSGTAPIMPDGADPPPDAYGQARRCLEIIGDALEQAGASFFDVVRTRIYLTRADAFEGAGRAHGEVFGDIRPANTTVIVTELVDPRWLLEIEARAFVPPPA
jgi:enamine deaminase RidA (YjgF/YER057c/UK114 family)